ncbi:integrase [Xanthomonas citri]|uniref:integrase n=1 Tax=Xanthomonas citri TaxID=346 RepID=UPI00103AD463|nr:integrase [Xanthomonas citri]
MSITSTPSADLSFSPSQRPPGKAGTRSPSDWAALYLRPKTPHPRRRPFTDSEIATIFASPSYERWATDPLLFWAPFLGLYMGLRASEVLRLSIEDIVEQHGVTCIVGWGRAAERTQDLHASRRSRRISCAWSIPVPQVLLNAGFLDYVASIREKQEQQLFPAIQQEPARDTAASLRSKFMRHVRSRGIKEAGFPALRQTFGQRIKKADIDWTHRKALSRESDRHSPVLKQFYPPLYRMDRFKKSLDKAVPVSSACLAALPISRFLQHRGC